MPMWNHGGICDGIRVYGAHALALGVCMFGLGEGQKGMGSSLCLPGSSGRVGTGMNNDRMLMWADERLQRWWLWHV